MTTPLLMMMVRFVMAEYICEQSKHLYSYFLQQNPRNIFVKISSMYTFVQFSEKCLCRVRYGRIQNQNKLTDILITDPNVHHQVIIFGGLW